MFSLACFQDLKLKKISRTSLPIRPHRTRLFVELFSARTRSTATALFVKMLLSLTRSECGRKDTTARIQPRASVTRQAIGKPIIIMHFKLDQALKETCTEEKLQVSPSLCTEEPLQVNLSQQEAGTEEPLPVSLYFQCRFIQNVLFAGELK